jgi:hypothetical protein
MPRCRCQIAKANPVRFFIPEGNPTAVYDSIENVMFHLATIEEAHALLGLLNDLSSQ